MGQSELTLNEKQTDISGFYIWNSIRSGPKRGVAMLKAYLCRIRSVFILAAAMCFAQPASATFHLWRIDKLYSDASGTVQYIELATAASGQQFLSGHAVSSSQGSSLHSFNFSADLPGDTANRKFLIGTQGFANLGTVAPDYVVPNGFLFLPGGSVNFAGVDNVTYGSIPTDSIHAIDRNGNPVTNAPENFAGKTGTIPATPSTMPSATDSYNSTNNQLAIPKVAVGNTAYTNVVITVGSVISIGSAPAAGAYDTYDGTYLTIPVVSAYGSTYYNVKITVGSVVSVGGRP